MKNLLFALLLLFVQFASSGQCLIKEIPIAAKMKQSSSVVIAKLTSVAVVKIKGKIWTKNNFKISSILKGQHPDNSISVLRAVYLSVSEFIVHCERVSMGQSNEKIKICIKII